MNCVVLAGMRRGSSGALLVAGCQIEVPRFDHEPTADLFETYDCTTALNLSRDAIWTFGA